MKMLKTLQRLFMFVLQMSVVLSNKNRVSFESPHCKNSCSDHFNCTVAIQFCSRDNHTRSKDIPGAPTHLEAKFTEIGENKARMLLKWRPPDDGSYKQLDGFEVTVHELITGNAARCYQLKPGLGWKQIHKTRRGGVSFYLDCLEVEFTAKVSVSVSSTPLDLNKPKNISEIFQYRKEEPITERASSWKPNFDIYSANYSDILLFANDYPVEDVNFFDILLKCEGSKGFSSSRFSKEQSLKKVGTSHGRLEFNVRGPIPDDKQCWIEVEPNLGNRFSGFKATRKFHYSELDCWEPLWHPRLQGLQAVFPSDDDKDKKGRPLTHLVVERPIRRCSFYHLIIYQQMSNERERKIIFNHTYDLSQKFDANKEPGLSYNENGSLEFIVQDLRIGKNYTFSMDALDSQKKPLPKVKRVQNEPLRIVAVETNHPITVEPVPAPAMDNRLKIVLGLIITVCLLLLVTLIGYCLSRRGSARFRNSGGLWSPNNSHGLKILPIYCWECESYQQAVKSHVSLVKQYACATWIPFPSSKRNTRWRCWSSLMAWLLAINQESLGKDVEAEIKNSEVIIYLSPRLAYLMSLESTSSQSLNSCDSQCWLLLSALHSLHSRGLGKQPHFVTFNCFNSAELACINIFRWMMGSAGGKRYTDQRSHGELSFRHGSSHRSPTHLSQDVQVMYYNSTAAEIQREETTDLMSPLILAVQRSGSWHLQNIQELLAQLYDIYHYPEHHHPSLSNVVVPSDWRNLPEVCEIERHIGLTARLYPAVHCDEQLNEDPSDSEIGDDRFSYTSQLPSPANGCCQRSDDQMEQKIDHNCTKVFPLTVKYEKNGLKNGEPETCISNTRKCAGAGEVRSKKSQQKYLPSGAKVRDKAHSQCTTPYRNSHTYSGTDCDSDSVGSSENVISVGFLQSHNKKLRNSAAEIKLHAKSCHKINQYTNGNSNSFLSLSNPNGMILPTLGVKVAAQLDKHPLGFSQDIIPPDQCRVKSGFTLEQMAQLNADNGWSEENLDTDGQRYI